MKPVRHIGFKAAEAAAAASGARNPGAVIAAGARNASPAAKRRNPRLAKVKGASKKERRAAVAKIRAGY
jgi:hypothetical protein